MKSIILYSKHLRNVSGVQTFELAFLQAFYLKYNITVVYELGDKEVIKEFKHYADVVRNEGKVFLADTCIYSSMHKDNVKIYANKYVQVVHTDYNHRGVNYNPNGIDEHVAVSKPVHDSLFDNFGITSTVIPNFCENSTDNAAIMEKWERILFTN